jgi:hypothetical protein
MIEIEYTHKPEALRKIRTDENFLENSSRILLRNCIK